MDKLVFNPVGSAIQWHIETINMTGVGFDSMTYKRKRQAFISPYEVDVTYEINIPRIRWEAPQYTITGKFIGFDMNAKGDALCVQGKMIFLSRFFPLVS